MSRREIHQRVTHAVQLRGDQGVEFGPGEPHLAVVPGQRGDEADGGLGGEPFLGHPALVAQPHQRADGRRRRGIDVAVAFQVRQHRAQDGGVDLVTGERQPLGLADRGESGRGVDQGESGAAGAEIQQRDHGVRQSGVGVQRGQGGQRVGNQGGADRGQPRIGSQCGLQCGARGPAPVRGRGDRDGVPGAGATDQVQQRGQGGGQQRLAAVARAVADHQRDGVADPFDEPAHHHAVGIGQVAVLLRGADFGGQVTEQGQHRPAADRRAADPDGDQVGGAYRHANRVAHPATIAATRGVPTDRHPRSAGFQKLPATPQSAAVSGAAGKRNRSRR